MKEQLNLIEFFKSQQCEGCRNGTNPCEHTLEELLELRKQGKVNAISFIEDDKGKRRYFCCVACCLLQYPPEVMEKIIVNQFNTEGHCETIHLK